jgi:putative endonuclease
VVNHNIQVGKQGETEAVRLLQGQGYHILKTNYRTRAGEVDIIARQGDTVCFIEVKARSGQRFGQPSEAVSRFKQGQISKAALHFLKTHDCLDKKARFDVVSIVYRDGTPQLAILKDAFELDRRYTY